VASNLKFSLIVILAAYLYHPTEHFFPFFFHHIDKFLFDICFESGSNYEENRRNLRSGSPTENKDETKKGIRKLGPRFIKGVEISTEK
jgi:hypothetical protein